MTYTPYATPEEYSKEYNTIPSEELDKRLKQASRHIDSLTFNRIVGIGYENLTGFQQAMITECVCELADFEYDNDDAIQSALQSY